MWRAVSSAGLLVALGLCLGVPLSAAAQFDKVLDNGPDAQHYVIVVLPEGYDSTEQLKFASDVKSVLVDGALKLDFYSSRDDVFNVYRVDVVSPVTGVTTAVPRASRSTALDIVYEGKMDDTCCVPGSTYYFQNGANTQTKMDAALGLLPSGTKIDYIIVLVNTARYGASTWGALTYAAAQHPSSTKLLAHECGHAVGHLSDEYFTLNNPHPAGVYNTINCSTSATQSGIPWAAKWSPGVGSSIPTTFNATTMDRNKTVGAFEGCYTYSSGIRRPADVCRMRDLEKGFCPVCEDALGTAVGPYVSINHPRLLPLRGAPQRGAPRRGGPQRGSLSPGPELLPVRYVPGGRGNALLQTPPAAAPPPYVNLMIEVSGAGGHAVTVRRAAPGSGAVIAPAIRASAFYEVTRNGTIIAAGPLPEDFLQGRNYNPRGSAAIETTRPAPAAIAFLTLPNVSLNMIVAGDLTLTLYQLNGGVSAEPITKESLKILKDRDKARITRIGGLAPNDFARAVRQAQQAANRGATPGR